MSDAKAREAAAGHTKDVYGRRRGSLLRRGCQDRVSCYSELLRLEVAPVNYAPRGIVVCPSLRRSLLYENLVEIEVDQTCAKPTVRRALWSLHVVP